MSKDILNPMTMDEAKELSQSLCGKQFGFIYQDLFVLISLIGMSWKEVSPPNPTCYQYTLEGGLWSMPMADLLLLPLQFEADCGGFAIEPSFVDKRLIFPTPTRPGHKDAWIWSDTKFLLERLSSLVAKPDISGRFPHRCPRCRSPAYISLFSIECSKPACG
jgi:hypothetical protein